MLRQRALKRQAPETLAADRADGVRTVHLEVRRSNQAAIALYRQLGFEQVGERRGYYRDNGEDALLMSLSLEAATQG